MGMWVDTDFGFDDLWALLVLRHHAVVVDGISLVAGNAPIEQVCRNAHGAAQMFDFIWPISVGAARPLIREPESISHILGPLGMQSRGEYLPQDAIVPTIPTALDAMCAWLQVDNTHEVLALGPLTNLAELFSEYPDLSRRISRITWMGGSIGRGNHTEFAEFNAIADPEALAQLVDYGAPLRIVDLEICRKVSYGQPDIMASTTKRGSLLVDLLGGYLDIALSRNRRSMSIYDPIAALAATNSAGIQFTPARLVVSTDVKYQYGRTNFHFCGETNVEVATNIDTKTALALSLSALTEEVNRV